jgi:hypothetical protein
VFERARRLAVSAVAGLGRRTVSGMLCAGAMQFADWSAAYRLFGGGRMDRRALFAPVLEAVAAELPDGAPLVAAMDDTLVRKRGRKVHGASWRRDPLGPRFQTNLVWGQRFLQISAALPDGARPGRARLVPIGFVHAPQAAKPRRGAADGELAEYERQRASMKLAAVAAAELKGLAARLGGRRAVVAVDGGYTNRGVFREIPEGVALIGRLRKDARLFSVPGAEGAPGKGRRRLYGDRLPTPEALRRDAAVPWTQVEACAAGRTHRFDVKALPAARWEGAGGRTVQVVAVRPLACRPRRGAKLLYREPAYLVCSDPGMPLGELLQAYLWRWEIELNFRDEKTVLGAGEAQVRRPGSVEDVPALVVASYACLLLAGERCGCAALARPKWRPPEVGARMTTQEMQGLFRAELWGLGAAAIKTGFESAAPGTRSRFYSENSMESAVCYATK